MHAYKEALTSLLLSAMLTSSLLPSHGGAALAGVVNTAAAQRALGLALGSAPSDFEFTSPATAVPRVVPASSTTLQRPISRTKLDSLARAVSSNPQEARMDERAAVSLGLTQPGVPYMIRQAFYSTDNGQVRHYIAVPSAGNNGILFIHASRITRTTTFWLSDRGGNLLAAGHILNGRFISIDLIHARGPFESELSEWSQKQLPGESPSIASS